MSFPQFRQNTDNSIYFKTPNIWARLHPWITPEQFGAVGDASHDDTIAITQAINKALSLGVPVLFLSEAYKITQPILIQPTGNLTRALAVVTLIGAKNGTRLFYKGSPSPYIMKIDGSASLAALIWGVKVHDITFDGTGQTTDGLYLKNVIGADILGCRATNITGAGLHAQFLQSSTITNWATSQIAEGYTTRPTNGILIDGTGTLSSNNTFINPIAEGVSGSGIELLSVINSVFVNGTSESNTTGYELGETTATQGIRCTDNTFIRMDLEANATDVVARATSGRNDFLSPALSTMQFLSSSQNRIFGGLILTSLSFDSGSASNILAGTAMGSAPSDLGTNNSWSGLSSYPSGTPIPDQPVKRRQTINIPNGGNGTINAAVSNYAQVIMQGATGTVNAPTNPVDGQPLQIDVFNISGAGTVVTWNAVFHLTWVNPANNNLRKAVCAFDAPDNKWYCEVSSADIPI